MRGSVGIKGILGAQSRGADFPATSGRLRRPGQVHCGSFTSQVITSSDLLPPPPLTLAGVTSGTAQETENKLWRMATAGEGQGVRLVAHDLQVLGYTHLGSLRSGVSMEKGPRVSASHLFPVQQDTRVMGGGMSSSPGDPGRRKELSCTPKLGEVFIKPMAIHEEKGHCLCSRRAYNRVGGQGRVGVMDRAIHGTGQQRQHGEECSAAVAGRGGLMASQEKVSFELGVEGGREQRVAPGSLS